MRAAISALSANAISAKAHAMYADILQPADYAALANCASVSEAAAYLTAHTAYGKSFADLPQGKIHRARLEARIYKSMMERIASLCAFEKSLGGILHRVFLSRTDIDNILLCADYLDRESVGEHIHYIPPFFKTNTEIDFHSLERAQSPADLFGALQNTPYAPYIANMESGAIAFSVPLLETVLYDALYKRIDTRVREFYSGESREAILDFFRMRADMKTVESIYRQKKYFRADTLPQAGIFFHTALTAFTKAEINAILQAETADELLNTVEHSRYGRFFPKGSAVIEQKTQMLQQKINAKNMRYSTCPPLVMLSFIGLLENEARNVIHIIEGIRYHQSPEEMQAHLIVTKPA